MTRTIYAADLFCGAGGASVGLRRACEALGLGLDLVAVNHWPTAVQTHMLNHPGVRHLCEAVERVNPRDAVPGGRLNLLMAGPSCVHHSRARGGRPVNEQDRASAFCILRWVTELQVDTVLVENVSEFASWGPVGANGRPLKRRKGELFRAWVNALEAANYRVEWRVINAANYGDPTTRSYYGSGGASPVSAPLPTATARDRFALVMPEVDGHRLDIRFRMLQPHELAAAMSFDPAYQFAGNRGDQVRQIGNAWPCRTAEALVRALLAERAAARPAPAREASA